MPKRCWTTIALMLALWIAPIASYGQTMTVHFIDVGQADATLLEFPCGAILIDAGSQSKWYTGRLVSYLRKFFERRDDLEGTLDVVFITHPHVDHNRALQRIMNEFQVDRYIDNGWTQGSGRFAARWVRKQIEEGNLDTERIEITDDRITALNHRNGLTNGDIDPIRCETCDPKIRILSSRQLNNPGWPYGDFSNQNNHSIVIRVDFGQSSFLFTGDIEEPAIETMVEWYGDTEMLDVDVYQVGHHGSHNGTTESLMQAMTPEMAVISCGKASSRGKWTARTFGHPRKTTVILLENHVNGVRAPIRVKVATGMKKFESRTITKEIYATGWGGTVRIQGRLDADPIRLVDP